MKPRLGPAIPHGNLVFFSARMKWRSIAGQCHYIIHDMTPTTNRARPLWLQCSDATRVNCVPSTFLILAKIIVLAGTAGAGGMAAPASTGVSARRKGVQRHSAHVNVSAPVDILLVSVHRGLISLCNCYTLIASH